MVKIVVFFKRKPGMSVEDFQNYWRTTHAGIVTKMPGIRRYVQSHTLLSGYRKGELAYDGVAELWFENTDAMRVLAPTAEYAAVMADEQNFIDVIAPRLYYHRRTCHQGRSDSAGRCQEYRIRHAQAGNGHRSLSETLARNSWPAGRSHSCRAALCPEPHAPVDLQEW